MNFIPTKNSYFHTNYGTEVCMEKPTISEQISTQRIFICSVWDNWTHVCNFCQGCDPSVFLHGWLAVYFHAHFRPIIGVKIWIFSRNKVHFSRWILVYVSQTWRQLKAQSEIHANMLLKCVVQRFTHFKKQSTFGVYGRHVVGIWSVSVAHMTKNS